jgi:hypothetical protein
MSMKRVVPRTPIAARLPDHHDAEVELCVIGADGSSVNGNLVTVRLHLSKYRCEEAYMSKKPLFSSEVTLPLILSFDIHSHFFLLFFVS